MLLHFNIHLTFNTFFSPRRLLIDLFNDFLRTMTFFKAIHQRSIEKKFKKFLGLHAINIGKNFKLFDKIFNKKCFTYERNCCQYNLMIFRVGG